MPRHLLRTGTGNPFHSHRLEGWEPVNPNVHFPVTFGVYEEGRNLALYLTPVGLGGLRDALPLPSGDQALVLDSQRGSFVLPWGQIDRLRGPADLVHFPREFDARRLLDELPCPLLADPGAAVPTRAGSRVAISLQDGCHGTVIARDPSLLVACLEGFIGDFQVAVLGRDAELPELPDALVESLVEPLPPASWWGLRLLTGRRYWTLELALDGSMDAPDSQQWVSEGEGGRWRSGWSW